MPEHEPRIDAPEFSISVWIRGAKSCQPIDGYIVRKPLDRSEPEVPFSEERSCWAMYQNAGGPCLVFGAHDMGVRDDPTMQSGWTRKEEMEANGFPWEDQEWACLEPELWENKIPDCTTWHLEVLTVNQTHATFWIDGSEVGSVGLRRPVTDCDNGQAMIQVGVSSVQLGKLQFYPRALSSTEATRTEIRDMCPGGSGLPGPPASAHGSHQPPCRGGPTKSARTSDGL